MLIAFVDYRFYLKIDNNLISFANIYFGLYIFAVEFRYLYSCTFLSPYISLQILLLQHYQMLHFILEKHRKRL